jgi:hypothetical protein
MLDAINELTYAVTSMVRTADVLNPTDPDLYRELAGGVTTLNLLHGSGNAIGGLNTVVKIKYGRPLEEFIFPGAMPGIKFALGENPKRTNFPQGDARHQVCARRESEAHKLSAGRRSKALSGHTYGRRRSNPRCLRARARLSQQLGGVSRSATARREKPDSPAPQSGA